MQKEIQELNGGWLKLEQKDTIESIVFAHQVHGFSCNKMIGFFFIVELSQAVQFMGIYTKQQNTCFFQVKVSEWLKNLWTANIRLKKLDR